MLDSERSLLARFLSPRFFAAVLAGLLWGVPAAARDSLYTDAEADCAARMIFMNECAGKDGKLLYWSPDETFPSIGIGHFIWYPAGASGPYWESFPGFLEFAEEIGLALPGWIAAMPVRHAPWADRGAFYQDLQSDRMRELQGFLRDTKREQARYILRRFRRVFPDILNDLDETEREPVRAKYDLLMASREGAFAMIDYVNFKGEGFRNDARYGGMGWGLAQVLVEMEVPDDPEKALDAFILAAERVLENRVRQSPRPEVESRWLPGWKKRLQGYRTLSCV